MVINMSMEVQNQSFLSIEQLTDRYLGNTNPVKDGSLKKELSFQEILEQKSLQSTTAEGLRFSKHATQRLMERNMKLSDSQMERLSDGAKKAEQKGIKDSLVIVDEWAFIVNVPNQTVVTAMDSTQTNENVFTNINGAVII